MRCRKFFSLLRDRNIPAALITMPENIRYLTGYTGEGALLCMPQARAVILTDFRYTEQANRQAPGCDVVMFTLDNKLPRRVREILLDSGVNELYFEAEHMLFSDYTIFQDAMPEIALHTLPQLVEGMRMVKDEHEISCIVRASEIACDAFEKLLDRIKPGISERDAQLELDYLMLRGGSESVAFSTIAAAGVNGSLPHAIPSDYKIRTGDLITFDFGAQIEGLKCDITRTVALGQPSDVLHDIYATVLNAQLAALDAIEPGVSAREVDAIARTWIDQKYPGRFGHSLGHGVGYCIHELPNLSMKSDAYLASGHVVTVEPGIYIPDVGGCRIEDTVILRPGGYVNPIVIPKNLIIL